jgi:hypothetical protein
MSLDFYLAQEACPTCGCAEHEVFWRNITHNVHAMWRLAGVSAALYESAGRKAAEIIPELEAGIADMEARPEVYTPLNPANGWGNYAGALNFLRSVRDACLQSPKATIRISA